MLSYPAIDPVALSIGPLQIHWYGIMYLLAFTGAYFSRYATVKGLGRLFGSLRLRILFSMVPGGLFSVVVSAICFFTVRINGWLTLPCYCEFGREGCPFMAGLLGSWLPY